MHNGDIAKFFPKLGIYSPYDYQEKAINNILQGNNTLCIVQTGGGKSLIYWMCAAKLGGITLVVSPLVALMSEQVSKLKEQGYNAVVFPGEMSSTKQMKMLKDIANGETTPDFIFASPEKIATDGFLEFCLKKRNKDIKLLVVDEIHCVSQWGINFRPFYKRIPDFVRNVFGDKGILTLGLTATLNNKEIEDICKSFDISNKNIVKQTILARSEICLHTMCFTNEKEKEDKFWDILRIHSHEKILVYIYRVTGKNSVEDLCSKAKEKGYNSTFFHGGMTSEKRSSIIEDFKTGKTNIVFATNAFGMGIDIPDINVVIHFLIPESLEQYYQEIGRAARAKDMSANAYLLYSNKNISVKETHFIDRPFPSEETLNEVFTKIATKVGYQTLAYFDDEEIQHCLPYYLESNLIKIDCKGFTSLKNIESSTDDKINEWLNLTKTKGLVITSKKAETEPSEIIEYVYQCYIDGKVELCKPFEKVLVLDILTEEITNDIMNNIVEDIEEKKKYKHDLLDYLVYTIKNNTSSLHLHQEIALYLGADKFSLNRIHATKDGNLVRSKSEVIISNQLFDAGIKYKYEKPLYYDDGRYILPDFTVFLPDGSELYWEHFGMLGTESYDNDTIEKLNIYDKYFPKKLLRTYESGNISNDADRVINTIKNDLFD